MIESFFRKVHFSFIVIVICFSSFNGFAQKITISIDATKNQQKVSPYIYGKNNSEVEKLAYYNNEVGVRFVRLTQGNNCTKYNWRKKIQSQPDWYNNVYDRNWDEIAQSYLDGCPNMQQMWAFQLIGRVASSKSYNFNDWEYNNSQYWEGVNQNLAGGGEPNESNPKGKALVEGDIELYTEEWPADSTVELLNHWFGENGLGFDKEQFLYWSMDNEPDIWNGTHDDVMPELISASDFVDTFIDVARKAKTIFPEIKICGPVTTSEWQWYKWGDESIRVDGKYYCWLEYFIMRLAQEEAATGERLIDVIDLHSYPNTSSTWDALQFHRIYFDENYKYPDANGIFTINGGWDTSIRKEYIFKRINDWLDKYFGENNGITLGISEWAPSSSNANVASIAYASVLGTFSNNGVELFTPWNWEKGMYETLHLFTHNAQEYSVSSISSSEDTLSAYTTVNENLDSMTVIIVNRDITSERTVTVSWDNITIGDGKFPTLQLAALPSYETFVSDTNNALKEGEVSVDSSSFTVTVPALSTTAVLLKTKSDKVGVDKQKIKSEEFIIYPNPVNDILNIKLNTNIAETVTVDVLSMDGKKVRTYIQMYDGIAPLDINVSELQNGMYVVNVRSNNGVCNKCFIKE